MKYAGIKVFSAALLFILAVWFFLAGLKQPVTWEYSELARNLIERHAFIYKYLGADYYCYCPPLYSFLVAIIYFISGYNHMSVIFSQIIIYSLLCVVVFKIGKDIFNIKTALITVVLLMAHPALLFYTLRYEHTLILDSLMFMLCAFCALIIYDKPIIRNAICFGVILGLASLSRGTALILLPLFMAWIILRFNLPIMRRLYLAALFFLAAMFTVLPWSVRNYIVTKNIILIGAATEESLWTGNNPHASGSSYNTEGKIILHDLASRDFLQRIYSLDEMGQKKAFEKEAIDFIKTNPAESIKLFLKKFYHFWWLSPQAGIQYPLIFKQIYKVYYIFILTGLFLGLCFIIDNKNKVFYDKLFLIIGIMLCVSFVQSLFYVETRHRWAIEPLLLILSAAGWSYLCPGIMKIKRQAL